MKSMLNKIDEFILILDDNGVIRFCNDKLLSKLKYNREELYNLNIYEIIDYNIDELEDIIGFNIENYINVNFISKLDITFSTTMKIGKDEFEGENLIYS